MNQENLINPALNIQKINRPHNLSTKLVILLFLQGSIYWVPEISIESWGLFKDILLAMFVFSVLIRDFVFRKDPFSYIVSTLEGKLLVLLVGFTVLGVFSSSNFLYSLSMWSRFLAAILLVCALFSILNTYPQLIPLIEISILIPTLISCIYIMGNELGIISNVLHPASYTVFWNKLYIMGFSLRRNAMAWIIAFSFPVCFFRLSESWKKSDSILHPFLWSLVTFLLLISILITDSRGGFISIISIIFIGMVLSKSEFKKIIFFPLVIIICLVTFSINATRVRLPERLHMLLRVEEPMSNRIAWNKVTSGRLEIFDLTLQTIKKRPLEGIGLGRFLTVSEEKLGQKKSPHNLFLALAVEAGIFPFVLGVVFIGAVFIRWSCYIFQNRKTLNSHFFILYSMLIVGIFSTTVERGTMFFNMHLGLPFWFSLAGLEVMKSSTNKLEKDL